MVKGVEITDPENPNRKLDSDDMLNSDQQLAHRAASKEAGLSNDEAEARLKQAHFEQMRMMADIREKKAAQQAAEKDSGSAGENLHPDTYEKAKNAQKELSPDELNKKEQEAGKQPSEDKLGKGYTGGKKGDGKGTDDSGDQKGGRLRRAGRRIRSGIKKRKRAAAIGGIMTVFGVVGGILMLSLLPFQLHHIMANVNAKAFARLQGVPVEGRSQLWLQAYLVARLLDIEDKEGNSKPDENILFRSNWVDRGNGAEFLRTLLLSRKFENDMFEKLGIKFASMAVRDGNQIKIRAAKITIKDTELTFDPFDGPNAIDPKVLDRAIKGDVAALEEIDRLTGKLHEFVDIELFDNKSARKEIAQALKELAKINGTYFWNGFLRWTVRRDIQNQTGITDWKFFETTRERWKESRISTRNKLIAKMLPANAKSGKFLRCMFGIESCRASTDPSDPANKNLPPGGKNSGGDKTDSEGNEIPVDTEGLESGVEAAVGAAAGGAAASGKGDLAKKIARHLIAKGNIALGIVTFIGALAIFDENMNNGVGSNMVQVARSQQVEGLYAYFGVASGQLDTGEAVSDEVDDFMGMVENTTNTEGWETGINERPNVVLAAGDEFIPASNKREFCSPEHQAMIENPRFWAQAVNEFYYSCDKAGVTSAISAFEDSWNNGIGSVLHPILQVWKNSIGVIVDIFQDIVDAIIGPIMDGILNLLGLTDNIEDLMGWLGEKVLEFSGAGPMWGEESLSGKIVNLMIQGAGVTAEASTRAQGGAETTPEMEKTTTERYTDAMRKKQESTSLYDRYLSLNSPDSVAANALFAIVNKSPESLGRSMMSSIGSIFSLPVKLFSSTVNAADDGVGSPYTIARKLAAIPTYDFPAERCLDRQVLGPEPKVVSRTSDGKPVYGNGASGDGLNERMTPQNATNAADPDIDLFEPEELNWDLVTDKERWYQELYSRAGDDADKLNKIKKVWNCALLDNAVTGAIGGLYGFKGKNALSSSNTIRE